MELLYRYKYKEINFRLLDSLLNEISSFTKSVFKGAGSLELEYNGTTIRVNSLDNLYKEWEERNKKMPEFFNFHVNFYEKKGVKNFNIYMFGNPNSIGFSIDGLPKQDAVSVHNIFQRIFDLELEKNQIDKVLKSKISKPKIEFSMNNPLVWLIFSLILIVISYFVYKILK